MNTEDAFLLWKLKSKPLYVASKTTKIKLSTIHSFVVVYGHRNAERSLESLRLAKDDVLKQQKAVEEDRAAQVPRVKYGYLLRLQD
jgi:hypothetical protein